MRVLVDDEEIWSAPFAEGVAIMSCPNPDCTLVHLVLFDDKHRAIAHAVLPDDPNFMLALERAMSREH